MSVFKQSYYKIDVLRHVKDSLEHHDLMLYLDLFDFQIDGDKDSSIKEFVQPMNVKQYIVDNKLNIKHSSTSILEMERQEKCKKLLQYLYPSQFRKVGRSLKYQEYTDQVYYKSTKQFSGIKCVYELYNIIYNKKLVIKADYSCQVVDTYAKQIIQQNKYSSWVNPNASSNMFDNYTSLPQYHYLLEQAFALQSILTHFRQQKYRIMCQEQKSFCAFSSYKLVDKVKIQGEYVQQYTFGQFPRSTYLQDHVNKYLYIISKSEIARVVNMLVGTYNYYYYLKSTTNQAQSLNAYLPKDLLYMGEFMIQQFLQTSQKQDPTNSNKVCAAYSSIYDLYLAHISNSLVVDSVYYQKKKMREKGYDLMVQCDEILQLVDTTPIEQAIDVLQFYKFLPVPDYCIHSAMTKQQKAHDNQHNMLLDGLLDVFKAEEVLTEKVKQYHILDSKVGRMADLKIYEQQPLISDIYPNNLKHIRHYRTCDDLSNWLKLSYSKQTAPIEYYFSELHTMRSYMYQTPFCRESHDKAIDMFVRLRDKFKDYRFCLDGPQHLDIQCENVRKCLNESLRSIEHTAMQDDLIQSYIAFLVENLINRQTEKLYEEGKRYLKDYESIIVETFKRVFTISDEYANFLVATYITDILDKQLFEKVQQAFNSKTLEKLWDQYNKMYKTKLVYPSVDIRYDYDPNINFEDDDQQELKEVSKQAQVDTIYQEFKAAGFCDQTKESIKQCSINQFHKYRFKSLDVYQLLVFSNIDLQDEYFGILKPNNDDKIIDYTLTYLNTMSEILESEYHKLSTQPYEMYNNSYLSNFCIKPQLLRQVREDNKLTEEQYEKFWPIYASINPVAVDQFNSLVKEQNQCHTGIGALQNQPSSVEQSIGLQVFTERVIDTFLNLQSHTLLKCMHQKTAEHPGRISPIIEEYLSKYDRNNEFKQDYSQKGVASIYHSRFVDYECIIPYDMPGDEYILSLKDKTCAPSNDFQCCDPETLEGLSKNDRNYLLWGLKNNIDPSKYCQDKFLGARSILVAFKPEAKKPDSRLFYMANPYLRSQQSVLENNVESLCSSQVGFQISKDPVQVQTFLGNMARAPYQWQDNKYRAFYISFDMEKWSPKLPSQMQRHYLEVFQKIYGEQYVGHLIDYYEDFKLVLNTHGINRSYKVKGSNLEGFQGKMLTKFHVDVMHTAMKLATELGIIDKPADFGAFIDDGITQVMLHSETYQRDAKRIFNLIEYVYSIFGLRISYDKTFTSETMFQYLNEVYFNGHHVKSGLKSVVKIGFETDTPYPTMTQASGFLQGQCTGAIKAGADPVICYYLYWQYLLFQYSQSTRWYHGKEVLPDDHIVASPMQLAIIMYTPAQLGGLGGLPFNCFDNTIYDNIVTEQLELLVQLSEHYPIVLDWIDHIMSRADKTLTQYQYCLNPTGLAISYSKSLTSRVSVKLKDKIEQLLRKTDYFNNKLQIPTDANYFEQWLEEILKTQVMNANILHDLYLSSPQHLVSIFISKFCNSTTLQMLLTTQEKRDISIAQNRDLKFLMRQNLTDMASEVYISGQF